MSSPPTITLRPFEKADVNFFASMASDERVTRFVGNGRPWDQQKIEARVRPALQLDDVEQEGATRWFLASEVSEPVGVFVSTRREDHVEIGYWVSPVHWGRGVAGAMVDYGLVTIPKVYGNWKLLARVDPANAASARLLTRRGFQLEVRGNGVDHYTLTQGQ